MYQQEAHTEQRSIIAIIKHCISLPYVTLTLTKVTVTKYTHDQIQNSDIYTEQQKNQHTDILVSHMGLPHTQLNALTFM